MPDSQYTLAPPTIKAARKQMIVTISALVAVLVVLVGGIVIKKQF